jgi:hypothetical protein
MTAIIFIGSTQAQVTTRNDGVGILLNEWYRDGTAAGLASISYENRDGRHSMLESSLYPQVRVFEHSQTTGPEKGPASILRMEPTVGNCSMAATAVSGGSLPRFNMMDPAGGRFLMMQYLANNLFVYPEHQDHDIGANGIGGYGDLFPANTPAVLISQGSSGSDQPFVKAVLATIAAFPRETQRVLTQKRLLMPTVQAILRQCNRAVKTPEDYFTGAAHPVVFDSAILHEEKMVRMAQAMTPDMIPPIAQVEVVEESEPESGKHFFEVPKPITHKLADARVSISRIFRGAMDDYVMVIHLGKSADLMGRPVQLRIQLLQGDPQAVRIESSGSQPYARLRFRWQPPFITREGIRSHRVDIGVFASNGMSISAPAIISLYMLPNERRFYNAQGRLAEIDYHTPNPDLGLPGSDEDLRWLRLMNAVTLRGDGFRSSLMEKLISEEYRKSIYSLWLPLHQRLLSMNALDSSAEANRRRLRADLESDLKNVLTNPLSAQDKVTLKSALTLVFQRLSEFSDLYLNFRQEIDKLAAQSPKTSAVSDIRREVQRLIDLGVILEQANGTLVTTSAPDRLSLSDQHYLRCLNLTVLSQALFPESLERACGAAFVDTRLTTPKPWRDVFRYDEGSGQLIGWVRHQASHTHFFDAHGRLLPEGLKSPDKALPVQYDRNAQGMMVWR